MTISFKDLCLLHLRDKAVQPFRPLKDLLDDSSHLVTWSTLQRLLHTDVHDSRPFAHLHQQGRLDDVKLAFAEEAIDLLERRRKERSVDWRGVYESIHELVWVFGFDQDLGARAQSFYRGQQDSRWRQVSSLLRPEPDGTLTVETVVKRVHETEAFIAELSRRQADLFASTPSDDEKVAVAQHYGFPTPMLDYTTSLRVASWFATSKANQVTERHSVIGVIHRLASMPETSDARTLYREARLGDFHLAEGATIRAGRARFVRPRLAEQDNRIARQEGLFITGFQPRDLQGVTLGSHFFWQEPGEVFEDPACNVTESYLLPDSSPTALLAKQVRASLTGGSSTLTRPLAGATFSHPALFGSTGFELKAALTDGRVFLQNLDSHISRLRDSEHIRSTLSQLFVDYFQLSQLRADLGQVPQARQQAVDPFGIAVDELARLSGIDPSALLVAALRHLPEWLRAARGWQTTATAAPPPSNDAERIALASSVFLASWELLQFVDGDTARNTAVAATGILGPVDDLLGFTS